MNVTKTYELPFSIGRVYAAWVSSNTVVAPATKMDIKPALGGHYRLLIETADFSTKTEGKFLAVKPGQHDRYTWEWNGDGKVTEIDVTFSATETGTKIQLLHSGFEKQESADMHSSGWDSYIK